jgi:hypothetical protein
MMFIFKYIINLIQANKVKTGFLIGMIFFSFLVYTKNSEYRTSEKFISKFEFAGKQTYVTCSSSNSLLIVSFTPDELPDEVDDMISYQKTSELYILWWVLLVVCGLFVIIPIFSSDDDVSWEFEDVMVNTTRQFVECHAENEAGKEIFYYVKNGRILIKCEESTWDRFNHSELIKRFIKYPKNFPKFEGTKEQKRDKKLNHILNEDIV